MKDSTKILGALVLGAAAGAVLGLLFAPSSGNELRKKIKDDTEGLIDELAEKISEGKETISGLSERVMAKADKMMSKMHETDGQKTKANSSTVGSNHNV